MTVRLCLLVIVKPPLYTTYGRVHTLSLIEHDYFFIYAQHLLCNPVTTWYLVRSSVYSCTVNVLEVSHPQLAPKLSVHLFKRIL